MGMIMNIITEKSNVIIMKSKVVIKTPLTPISCHMMMISLFVMVQDHDDHYNHIMIIMTSSMTNVIMTRGDEWESFSESVGGGDKSIIIIAFNISIIINMISIVMIMLIIMIMKRGDMGMSICKI